MGNLVRLKEVGEVKDGDVEGWVVSGFSNLVTKHRLYKLPNYYF